MGRYRQLCALLLCLLLLPGWGELMENVEHLVHDGHPAHLVSHDDDDDGEDEARHEALAAEHGCTPLSHTCPCHTSIPAVLPVGFELPAAPRIEILRDRPPGLEQHVRHRANAPPVPPPRA